MTRPFPLRPELDRAYNARESVVSFEDEYGALVALSRTARRSLPVQADLVFDRASGMKLDLYGAGDGRPVLLWIHGGYWRLGNKEDNAFAAPGLVAQGVAVAVMDYTPAPAVSLDEIVREVRQAVAWLHRNGGAYGLDTTRVHVGGSSAGGHLTGMLLTGDWEADFGLPQDVIGVALALSGLFELEPLLYTQVNDWARMDQAAVARLSPMRHIPDTTEASLILSVGGLEPEGFPRQTQDYHTAWIAAGHKAEWVEMPGYNHFDISGTLSDPSGDLVQATAHAIAAQRG
ncbi:alpha/beta hydrolase [Aestuariivita sp.]|jgi:arylformamidase|uniref:alpha/beta hydrolase n=1 Tax=Aestuariivita sp. TaxID=1872407 RepID=UPI0021732A42|nr:alpha/beta hydrolase [Aestuariivita sp.]MCE8005588.1 alpha/beta hydrolase [Aestuariivita sp.]